MSGNVYHIVSAPENKVTVTGPVAPVKWLLRTGNSGTVYVFTKRVVVAQMV